MKRAWASRILALTLLSCVGVSANAAIFPLKVHSSQRYLADQRNDPFLIQGEAPWSLIVALTTNEVNLYLADRHARGVNTLVVNLIEHQFDGGDNPFGPPKNRFGQGPFLTPGDFSTPNNAYFNHADWVLHRCAEEGFTVLLTPCYLGYPGTSEGWFDEVNANGTNKCRAYGQYLGQRYLSFSNIIWVAGGDRNPDSARPEMLAVIAGLRQFDTNKLWTAHNFPESSAADQYEGEPWLALNTTYTYADTYVTCLSDYARIPTRPTFLFESHYENDFGGRNGDDTRHQAWWAVLSGSCGQVFGNRPLWLFDTGWTNALNTVGAQSQTHLLAALLSRPWERLVPETGAGLVIGGLGSGATHRAAARAPDGASALVYLPQGGTVNIDLSRIAGPLARAWWFNPRAGAATDLGIFTASGSQNFTAPDSFDWVLVLDDHSKNFPAPGSRDIHAHVFANWIEGFPALPAAQKQLTNDFDADGLNNIAEYTFNGNPTVADASIRPRAGVATNRFTLVFPFNTDADDLAATVERTSTLTPAVWSIAAGTTPAKAWTNAPGFSIEILSNNLFGISEASSNSQRFFRVRFGLIGN